MVDGTDTTTTNISNDGTDAAAAAAQAAAQAAAKAAAEKGGFPDLMASFSEDLREDPTLKNFQSVEGLAKSYVNLRKTQPEDMIAKPQTDEDWGKFYDEMGRPETADAYVAERPKMPEGVPYDEDSEKFFRGLAHANGLNQKQFDNIYQAEINRRLGMVESGISEHENYVAERDVRITKEFGDSLEFHKSSAHVAIKAFVGDEDADSIMTEKLSNGVALGDDLRFIKLFSKVGKEMVGETKIKQMQGEFSQTPADIQTSIDEFRATHNKALFDKNHPEHKLRVGQMDRLYEQRHGKVAVT